MAEFFSSLRKNEMNTAINIVEKVVITCVKYNSGVRICLRFEILKIKTQKMVTYIELFAKQWFAVITEDSSSITRQAVTRKFKLITYLNLPGHMVELSGITYLIFLTDLLELPICFDVMILLPVSQLLCGIMHMIYRWKDTKKPQLFHVHTFHRFHSS